MIKKLDLIVVPRERPKLYYESTISYEGFNKMLLDLVEDQYKNLVKTKKEFTVSVIPLENYDKETNISKIKEWTLSVTAHDVSADELGITDTRPMARLLGTILGFNPILWEDDDTVIVYTIDTSLEKIQAVLTDICVILGFIASLVLAFFKYVFLSCLIYVS